MLPPLLLRSKFSGGTICLFSSLIFASLCRPGWSVDVSPAWCRWQRWQIVDASQQTRGGKLLATLAGDDLQGAIACTDDFVAAAEQLGNSYTVMI